MARIDGSLVRFEQTAGVEFTLLAAIGTVPGVRVVRAAALNGRGVGYLMIDSSNNLRWTAPGSFAAGTAVDVSAGGNFYLADGTTPDKWILVNVTAARLPGASAAQSIQLDDVYHNAVSYEEVTLVPYDQTWTLYLTNYSGSSISSLVFWLDPDEPANRSLLLTWGVNTAVVDWSEAAALLRTTITLTNGASTAIGVRRQLGGSEAADPSRLIRLFGSWNDTVGGRGKSEARGMFRVRGTAMYQAYHKLGSAPTPGVDTAFATSASLPFTPTDTFGDGDRYFTLTKKSAYGLESTPHHTTRMNISGGTVGGAAPNPPSQLQLFQSAGIVTAKTLYTRPADSTYLADTFALWYTTDGSTPGSGSPNATASVSSTARGAWWIYALPAQVDGVVVKVLVKMKKGSVYSDTGLSASLTVDAAGPSAPAAGTVWRTAEKVA